MAIIIEDYVSFETAKLLKEKGFPQTTFRCHYIIDSNIHYKSFENRCGFEDYDIIAPTRQMAMKWLRENHHLWIDIDPLTNYKWTWSIWFMNDSNLKMGESSQVISTYEEACEAAIKYCLENLI